MAGFSERLRSLRAEEGKSQKELAKALGIAAGTVSMYETGNREPDFETLEKIADHFGVDMDYLLGRKGVTHKIVEAAPDDLDLLERIGSLGKEEKQVLRRMVAYMALRDK